MERLRPLIRDLRRTLGTKYPLAEARPLYADGRELLWEEQSKHDLDGEPLLVVQGQASDGYQLVLSDVAKTFVDRVEFEPDPAARSPGSSTVTTTNAATRAVR